MKKYTLSMIVIVLIMQWAHLCGQAGATQERFLLPPVHAAVITGNKEMLNGMIKNGTPIDTQDDIGVTPLFYALVYGKLDMARKLLRHGARKSTYQQCRLNASPLHAMIIEHVNPTIVARVLNSELLENCINHKAAHGFTPLMCAAYIGGETSLLIAKELLRRGADRYAKNDFHQNALTIALYEGNIEHAIEIARNWNPYHDKPYWFTPAHYAVFACPPLEHARAFLSSLTRNCISTSDINAQTPLFAALAHGKTELASLLLEHGAFIELRDIFKATPLHVIIVFSRDISHLTRTLNWLREHSIMCINTSTKTGETPITLAKRIPCKETREKILRLLIEYATRSQTI